MHTQTHKTKDENKGFYFLSNTIFEIRCEAGTTHPSTKDHGIYQDANGSHATKITWTSTLLLNTLDRPLSEVVLGVVRSVATTPVKCILQSSPGASAAGCTLLVIHARPVAKTHSQFLRLQTGSMRSRYHSSVDKRSRNYRCIEVRD